MAMNSAIRNKTIDYMKGIGILFVVVAHTDFPYLQYIYLFHMAVFFIISGYCYRELYSENIMSVVLFFKKKLKSLYAPYVLFNLILICLHNLFYRWNVYTDNPLFVNSPIIMAEYGQISKYSAKDFIYHIVLTLGFVDGEQLAGTLWFLRALFEVSIIYVVIDWIGRRFRRYRMWFVCIISVGIMTIGYVLQMNSIHIVTGVEEACYYFIFFLIGVLLQKVNINKILPDTVLIVISAALLFISYSLLDYPLLNTKAPVFYVTNGCLGGIMIKGLAGMLMKTRIADFLEYAGKNSLQIMLWHFLAFKVVSLCYIKIYSLPEYYLASFTVLKTEYWWIAYAIVGVILPLLGIYLVNLIREKANKQKKRELFFGRSSRIYRE